VVQDQTISQHKLRHHRNPKMPAALCHNTLCIKYSSRGIRGKRLQR